MHFLKKVKKNMVYYHYKLKKKKYISKIKCDFSFFLAQTNKVLNFQLNTLVLVQKYVFKKLNKNVQVLFKIKINRAKTKKNNNSRMGKGKSNFLSWNFLILKGKTLCSFSLLPKNIFFFLLKELSIKFNLKLNVLVNF